MIRVQPSPAASTSFAAPERRPVVAVLTGSSRDLTVARLAAGIAGRVSTQLVLAVPTPADRFSPTRADLRGRLPRHAESIVTRVVSRLGASTLPLAAVAVPYPDRGDPAARPRRIAAALVDLCRRLAVRELVVTDPVAVQPGSSRLTEQLHDAASTGQLRSTALAVIAATATANRPGPAAAPQPAAGERAGLPLPAPRTPPAASPLRPRPAEPYAAAGDQQS